MKLVACFRYQGLDGKLSCRPEPVIESNPVHGKWCYFSLLTPYELPEHKASIKMQTDVSQHLHSDVAKCLVCCQAVLFFCMKMFGPTTQTNNIKMAQSL